jgi:hypothetical protein
MSLVNPKSIPPRMIPTEMDTTSTNPVKYTISRRVSHVTFFISATVSLMNLEMAFFGLGVDGLVCVGNWHLSLLPDFAMELLRAASRAEFIELQTLGVIPFIFFRCIGSFLAFCTGKSNDYPIFTFSHFIRLSW